MVSSKNVSKAGNNLAGVLCPIGHAYVHWSGEFKAGHAAFAG